MNETRGCVICQGETDLHKNHLLNMTLNNLREISIPESNLTDEDNLSAYLLPQKVLNTRSRDKSSERRNGETPPLSPRDVRKARHSIDLQRNDLIPPSNAFTPVGSDSSTDSTSDGYIAPPHTRIIHRKRRHSGTDFAKLRRSLSHRSFQKAFAMGLVELPDEDDSDEKEQEAHRRLLKQVGIPSRELNGAGPSDSREETVGNMTPPLGVLRATGKLFGVIFYSTTWTLSLVMKLMFVITSVLGILWYSLQLLLLRALRYVMDFQWKRKERHVNLECSQTYEEWACTQLVIEKTNGAEDWRSSRTTEAGLYDHQIVKDHITELNGLLDSVAHLERTRDESIPIEVLNRMEDHLKPFMSRHHSNLDDARLHSKSDLGTKYDVEEYLDLGETLLDKYTECVLKQDLVSGNGHNTAKRLKRMKKWQRALGETALCLSGGGMAAMSHLGVVKALIQGECLPRVISGSSGGGVTALFLAIHTDDEIIHDICVPELAEKCDIGGKWLPSFTEKLQNLMSIGVLVDSEQFIQTYRYYVQDYTFAEAYERTGRCVNIAVTRADMKGYPTVLNHITAPDVFLWSALAATCCIPGLMHPVELKAKKIVGKKRAVGRMADAFEVIPAFPKGVRWVDGSLAGDLPTQFLRRQFNCNQFIVSQVNPHVAPFLLARKDTNVSDFIYRLELGLGESLGFCFSTLAKNGLIPELFGQGLGGIALQKYGDDNHDTILVLPHVSLGQYMEVLNNPTREAMARYIRNGELAIWPRLAQIEHRVRVEMKLRECINELKLRGDE